MELSFTVPRFPATSTRPLGVHSSSQLKVGLRTGLRLVSPALHQQLGTKYSALEREPRKWHSQGLLRHAGMSCHATLKSTAVPESVPSAESGLVADPPVVHRLVGPNAVVQAAQARVCTGPTQTRPLDEGGMREVLQTILKSVRGELPVEDQVSAAQLGAFFGGLALRAAAFPPPTQWSAGERAALEEAWPELRRCLPDDVLFVADPEGSLFDDMSPVGPAFSGRGTREDQRLVGALREVLVGGHLGYEENAGLLRDALLPARGVEGAGGAGAGGEGRVSDALLAALLICQRMNLESERELKAYCFAFDDELGPLPVAEVASLTHYGEPYDGNTRFMRSTLFVAAVRASYGESCLIHGTDLLGPKMGVTEEQMLELAGARTTLTPGDAVRLLEDEDVGFAYVSQQEARPSLYSLKEMRRHIKKRPIFATAEKVQRYVEVKSGREAMVAGYYHDGYEEPLLMLIRRRGVDAGLVIKGEEGGAALAMKPRSTDAGDAPPRRRPVNFCCGFRTVPGGLAAERGQPDAITRSFFEVDAQPTDWGFEASLTPRTDRSARKNLELGLSALRNEPGPALDRIVFNAAMHDHLLRPGGGGSRGTEAVDPRWAIERAREAIASGRALRHFQAYVEKSHRL